MVVKLKKDDLEQAVREYIRKLFPDVIVRDMQYSKATKGNSVVVEVEVQLSPKTEKHFIKEYEVNNG